MVSGLGCRGGVDSDPSVAYVNDGELRLVLMMLSRKSESRNAWTLFGLCQCQKVRL